MIVRYSLASLATVFFGAGLQPCLKTAPRTWALAPEAILRVVDHLTKIKRRLILTSSEDAR
jgi:hypothetical protein